MTVSFPRTDIVDTVGYSDQVFQLTARQEFSRTAGGITYGKDLGDPLWFATYTTGPLASGAALRFEAALNSLDGVINPFEAGDLRRPYPAAHANGSFNDTGEIKTIGENNKSFSLKGLDPGMTLGAGDYIAFDVGTTRALHQLMEDATADEDGVTPEFEVRPHLWPGTAVDTAVTLKKPRGLFMLMPGSVSTRMQGGLHTVVSFQAGQIIG